MTTSPSGRLDYSHPRIVSDPPTPVPVDRVSLQVDDTRRAGIRRALELLRQGRPGLANYTLARSVMQQVRIAGHGTLDVQPTCPCGGRCPNGGGSR